MATALKDYKPPAYSGTDYPWDKWMDGQYWLLVHGEDFSCTPRSFQATARTAAAKRNLSLSITQYVDPDKHEKVEGSFVLRATPKQETEE